MRTADKAAIDVVRKKAATNFGQHIMYLQSRDRPRWTKLWRSVRLRCRECEEGYLRPLPAEGKDALCTACEVRIQRSDFWRAKASVVVHLFADEDHGELWPYFLVDVPERVPA